MRWTLRMRFLKIVYIILKEARWSAIKIRYFKPLLLCSKEKLQIHVFGWPHPVWTHLITKQVFWHFIVRFLLCKSPFVFFLQRTPVIVRGGGGGSDGHRWGHPQQRDSGDLRVCASHWSQRRRHRHVGTRDWGPITTDWRADTHWNLKGIVML